MRPYSLKARDSSIKVPFRLTSGLNFAFTGFNSLNGKAVIDSPSLVPPKNPEFNQTWIRGRFSDQRYDDEYFFADGRWLSKQIYQREIFVDAIAADKDYFFTLGADSPEILILDIGPRLAVGESLDQDAYWDSDFGYLSQDSLQFTSLGKAGVSSRLQPRKYDRRTFIYNATVDITADVRIFVLKFRKINQASTLNGAVSIRYRKIFR